MRTIEGMLYDIDRPDRIKFCKSDFVNTVKALKSNKKVWSKEVFDAVLHLSNKYFNQVRFLLSILSYLLM